jgi:hypothetical protein
VEQDERSKASRSVRAVQRDWDISRQRMQRVSRERLSLDCQRPSPRRKAASGAKKAAPRQPKSEMSCAHSVTFPASRILQQWNSVMSKSQAQHAESARNYRDQATASAQAAKAAASPKQGNDARNSEKAYISLAENEEWLAENAQRVV